MLEQLGALDGGPYAEVGPLEPGEELCDGEEEDQHGNEGLDALGHKLRYISKTLHGACCQAVDDAAYQECQGDRHRDGANEWRLHEAIPLACQRGAGDKEQGKEGGKEEHERDAGSNQTALLVGLDAHRLFIIGEVVLLILL